jgi:hypothetical protein
MAIATYLDLVRLSRLLSHIVLSMACLAPLANAAGILIPVTARRDHVFDDTRHTLYITTSNGNVERYDVASHSLLTPFAVAGTSFNGIDISLDNHFIYVADATQGATDGFRKFNTDTGARTNLFYTRAFGEGRSMGHSRH